jgi:hypothetical protein
MKKSLGKFKRGENRGMNTIHIDPEFKSLIPPLSKEEYDLLEKSILSEGCRDPLVVWQNGKLTLIDGHNRYEICSKNNVNFKLHYKTFTNTEEVKDWIITNQLGRRNLTDSLREYFRGKLYESRKKRERGGGDKKSIEYKNQRDQNDPIDSTLKKTAEIIAKEQNVSPGTVKRSYQYSQAIDTIGNTCGEEIKQKILKEEIKTTKEEIKSLVNKKPEEQKQIIEKIKTGEAKTINNAILAVNRDKPREVKPLPVELYDVIYSDPLRACKKLQ